MLVLLPALVTALTVVLLFAMAFLVGRARGRYDIKAPAVSGHPVFERVWRVQMNTLEATLMFLPSLWLASHYSNPTLAGILGLVWLAARAWYASAYIGNPQRRGLPFILGTLCMVVLLVAGLIGVLHGMWLLYG